jgi:hypothetical protein
MVTDAGVIVIADGVRFMATSVVATVEEHPLAVAVNE